MKHLLPHLAILFLVFAAGCARPQAQSSVSEKTVGRGWARNAVNTAVFRRNSVVSHQGRQYTAYYDSTGHVVLAKRDLPAGSWQVKRTAFTGNVKDAHNVIAIIVDGEGYLHLSWDHHGHPLKYSRSVAPGALDLLAPMPMTGRDENRVTYPEFYKMPDGDLLFLYRSGASGQGNLVLNRYRVKDKAWTQVQDVLVDGEGQRNAYWQANLDAQGTFHLSWVWRETGDVASNHDIGYARSRDGGLTWEKSTGEAYKMPITQATAEYALRIPQKSELINTTSMSADGKGNPYIATYWRPAGTGVPQYHLVYHNGQQWQSVQVSQRQRPFSLSGGGTKKIPMSRPQVVVHQTGSRRSAYMIFRDVERDDKVSVSVCNDLAKGIWTVADLTSYGVGHWEPTYDTELWKEKKQLHLFVQKVGQGDGETLENLAPQPVTILEWRPGK
jgi:hypothetical protein